MMTSTAVTSGNNPDCEMLRKTDYFLDTQGDRYDSCYYTDPSCNHQVPCGLDEDGNDVFAICSAHRKTGPYGVPADYGARCIPYPPVIA